MSWRTVVISSSAKLDYQMGYMVVRTEKTVKVHISEIEILLIESTSVSLTAALLCELTKKKVKVIFCDEKRNPSSELVPYYGSHDVSAKLRRQMAWSSDQKLSVWTKIVSEKIRKQAELLERYQKSEADMLRKYIEEIEYGDTSNREGHAAKVYFNAIFGKDFTRMSDSSINAALNYGYGVILSAFNREIVANGYLTQIGIFHDNTFNPFNLGSDMMEPFRPIIDAEVRQMMPDQFQHKEKMQILRILQAEVLIADRKEYLTNAIRIYCKSVINALNEKDVSLIKTYEYEL